MNNLSSDTSWAKFPENRDRSGSDKSSGHDSSEDVWLITPEQREYYTNQFKTLIPNTKGLLSGEWWRLEGLEFWWKMQKTAGLAAQHFYWIRIFFYKTKIKIS